MNDARERGSVALELVAYLALLGLIVLGALQAAAVGQAAVAARTAARAASAAAASDLSAAEIEAAARAATAPSLRAVTSVVARSGTRVTVSVGIPPALPGIPADILSIHRTAELPRR